MEFISSSDLKTILHSKRANLYYLEHCRVLVNGGRVEYLTEKDKQSLYWNIPIANTTVILLGTGTSITQAAMCELAKAGVMIGFCGGAGTPLYSANEYDIDVSWVSPQSEYRPTEYLQDWVKIWFKDEARLQAAKIIQFKRIQFVKKFWGESSFFKDSGFYIQPVEIESLCEGFWKEIQASETVMTMFTCEARCTKKLFALACKSTSYQEFKRVKQGIGTDPANCFLDHGNYLAYGLGATATWVLGLPHAFSVMHGKTRRGGLVFDVADLIKDALVLPQAFISAANGDERQLFRRTCIDNFARAEALDYMIDSLKEIILDVAKSL